MPNVLDRHRHKMLGLEDCGGLSGIGSSGIRLPPDMMVGVAVPVRSDMARLSIAGTDRQPG